jgi:hypothetical protein
LCAPGRVRWNLLALLMAYAVKRLRSYAAIAAVVVLSASLSAAFLLAIMPLCM